MKEKFAVRFKIL